MTVTLNIDEEIVERARKLADAYGTSLSVIVGAFLQEIATGDVSIEEVMHRLERQADGRKWSRRDLYRY
jgi:antitoxin component of RelBE/YafQ-DinJ toxin-antitoxin module